MSSDLVWDTSWRLPAAPAATVASPEDTSHAEFHRGLFAFSRIEVKSKISYCSDWLIEIDRRLQFSGEAGAATEGLAWTKLAVGNELSRLLLQGGNQIEHARAVLRSALDFAFQRNDEALVSMALTHLGSFEGELYRGHEDDDAFTRAEIYYQRAMIYAGRGPAAILASTLGDLAHLWSLGEDTYKSAIKLIDWWFVLRPDALGIIYDKYRLLAVWEPDVVASAARKKKYADAFEAVQTAAASATLQQKKRSSAALEVGLTMARAENNIRLVESIERHLNFEQTKAREHAEFLQSC